MSVDTYLKGKNTAAYRTLEPSDGVTIMVTPKLMSAAHRIELVTRKRLVGSKLVAVVYLEDPGR